MAKYRIVPSDIPNLYSVQERWGFFWTTLEDYLSLDAADLEIHRLVNSDSLRKDAEERRRSWKKAVPAVYYDENGKRLK